MIFNCHHVIYLRSVKFENCGRAFEVYLKMDDPENAALVSSKGLSVGSRSGDVDERALAFRFILNFRSAADASSNADIANISTYKSCECVCQSVRISRLALWSCCCIHIRFQVSLAKLPPDALLSQRHRRR